MSEMHGMNCLDFEKQAGMSGLRHQLKRKVISQADHVFTFFYLEIHAPVNHAQVNVVSFDFMLTVKCIDIVQS